MKMAICINKKIVLFIYRWTNVFNDNAKNAKKSRGCSIVVSTHMTKNMTCVSILIISWPIQIGKKILSKFTK